MTRAVWAALALAAALTLAAAAILARPPRPRHPALAEAWLRRLDPDGDGALSAAEERSLAPPGAPSWDLDRDGFVRAWEIEAGLWAVDPAWLRPPPQAP